MNKFSVVLIGNNICRWRRLKALYYYFPNTIRASKAGALILRKLGKELHEHCIVSINLCCVLFSDFRFFLFVLFFLVVLVQV